MLFEYVGDGDDPPSYTVVFGYPFMLGGTPVDVGDPVAIAKLQGNASFRVACDLSPADEKADLAAQLERAGVRVDGRWGLSKLRRMLRGATYGED